MSNQERIKELEKEVAELRGKVQTLELLLTAHVQAQSWNVYPAYPQPPVYPWQWITTCSDNTLNDGHSTVCRN